MKKQEQEEEKVRTPALFSLITEVTVDIDTDGQDLHVSLSVLTTHNYILQYITATTNYSHVNNPVIQKVDSVPLCLIYTLS